MSLQTVKTEELVQLLETRQAAVFGTGFVAEMFYLALERNGLWDRIRFCVTTSAPEGETFHGRPVVSLGTARFSDRMLLCAAVHESVWNSLQESLAGISCPAVWIYPCLFELLYGKPVCPPSMMPLREIIRLQDPEEFWIAARYAAVRDYMERSADYPRTRELYRKALSLHCGPETAVRRNRQMEKLADSMAENGFLGTSRIQIDASGRIIDGLHRVACAKYFRVDSVPVQVYPVSEVYDRVLGERNRLPERILRANGFSDNEIGMLRNARDEFFSPVREAPGTGRIPGYQEGTEELG